MLKCNFLFRGMCLSTFSHDAVQILASPESIAGGPPNCKTGEFGKKQNRFHSDENVSSSIQNSTSSLFIPKPYSLDQKQPLQQGLYTRAVAIFSSRHVKITLSWRQHACRHDSSFKIDLKKLSKNNCKTKLFGLCTHLD